LNYQNPYAPPQPAPPVAGAGAIFGPPQPWSVGEAFSVAWERFRENWVVLVFSYLLPIVVTQLIGRIPNALQISGALEKGSPTLLSLTIVCALLSYLLSIFLQCGLTRIWVDAALGQSPPFDALFSQGAKAARYLGVALLTALAVLGGLLLFIVPGIIIALGFSLAPYYVIDGEMGPIRAMQASWAATRGQKAQIFVLGLASVGITLVGLAACCVGFFGAVPVCSVAMTVVYLRLSGRAAPLAAAEMYPPPPGYGPAGRASY
jgi:uncharacterized membrane protein